MCLQFYFLVQIVFFDFLFTFFWPIIDLKHEGF